MSRPAARGRRDPRPARPPAAGRPGRRPPYSASVVPVLLAAARLAGGASARSDAVSWHVLLTAFQRDPVSLLADALELAAVGAYAAGVRRLARRGRHWSAASTVAFVLGLLAIFVAIGSGLAAYDESNVTLHVLQHVLLMMVAPPLLALGKPVTLAVQALDRRHQVRLLRVVHSTALSLLQFPIAAWILYYGTMYLYFLTPVYRYSLDHLWFHYATHGWFVVVGYLYWQPLVGLDPGRARLPYPARIGSLFLGMPFEAFLGVSIASMSRPIAPINTLADTHTAGNTLWILSMMLSGLCLAVLVVQWFRQLDRETPREDRRVEAATAENRARAAELGVSGLPEGFTVPPWRLAELEAEQARTTRPDGVARRGAAG